MNTARNNRFSRPVMEQIEGRLLLDGTVTAVVAGNTLKITGDNLGNIITLTQNSNVVTITPDVGTSINGQTAGASVDLDNTFKQISMKMGDGHDNVTISAIAGATGPFLVGSNGNGQLKIDMGKGPDDEVTLTGISSGNVEIEFGNDGSSLTVNAANPDNAVGGPTDIRTSITGKLTVEGGKGNDSVTIDGAAISDSVRLDLRDGNDSVAMDTFEGSDLNFGLSIQKDFTVSNSKHGADTVNFLDSGDAGAVTIGGNVRLDMGDSNSTVTADPFATLDVGKDLAINFGGNGVSHVTLLEAFIGRDLSIRTGDGTDTVDLSSINAGRNVRVDMGKGVSTLNVDFFAFDRTSVAGEFRASLGDDADTATISGGSVGKLRLDMGKGDDQLTIKGLQDGGDAKIDLGDGTNTATITGLDLDGAGGNPDFQSSIGKNLAITGGKGNDTVTLNGVSVGTDARLNMQAGDDHVTVDTYNGADTDFDTSIGGSFILSNSGHGADVLSILDTANVGATHITKDLIATMGDAGSTITATSAAALAIGKNASLKYSGKGVNQLNLTDAVISNNLDARMADGADTINLLGLTVGNNASLDTRSGDDVVDADQGDAQAPFIVGERLKINLGAQNDVLTLAHAFIGNGLLDGGPGTDTLNLDAMTVAVQGRETIKNFE